MGTVGGGRWSVRVGYREEQMRGVGYREKQVDMCGMCGWVHTGCKAHVGHGARAGSFFHKQGPSPLGPACRHCPSPAGLTPTAQNKQPFPGGIISMSAPALPGRPNPRAGR